MEHMFVGRKLEMERLESLYARPGLNTCAVFGRRQTGKSTLLAEFSKKENGLPPVLQKGGELQDP